MTASQADLWRIRLFYLVWIGGGGFLYPFVSLFYRAHQLSGTEIGALTTIGAIGSLVMAPLWGRWSDAHREPRRLLQFALLGTGLAILLLGWQIAFWGMALAVALDAAMNAATEPMADTLTLGWTRGQTQAGFGSVRLWGSLGWAILAYAGGWLIEHWGLSTIFAGYAVCMGLGLVILQTIRVGAAMPKPATDAPAAPQWRGIVHDLLADRALLGLALALAVMFLTASGYHQFEAIFLKQLGASESVIGLASTLGALVELPVMWWADHLMRARGSHRVLMASFLLHAGTMAIILLWPTVPAIILAKTLTGVAFGFFAVSLVVFIGERAPQGQSAMLMALFGVTLPGLVRIIAGPLGGVAFDAVGAYWLYALGLSGYLIGWLALRLTVRGRRSRIVSE